MVPVVYPGRVARARPVADQRFGGLAYSGGAVCDISGVGGVAGESCLSAHDAIAGSRSTVMMAAVIRAVAVAGCRQPRGQSDLNVNLLASAVLRRPLHVG